MNTRTSLPTPGDNTPPDEDLFGWTAILHWIGFVLRAPLRHKLLAGFAFVTIFGLACAALAVVPFRYQVQATLLAGYSQASALSNSVERPQDAPTRAAREMVLRRENLRAIVEKTGFVEQYLARRPWAIRTKDEVFEYLRGKPRTREDLIEGLLDTLQNRLWIEAHHEGTLVITFQWWDPELARQIVEAAQQSFIAVRRASEVEAIGEAIAILEAQQERLNSDIQASIEVFERKQEELRLSEPKRPRVTPARVAADPELERLRGELATKQRSLGEIESFRRERTVQLQAELSQQETVYAADHPSIVGTRRLLKSLGEPTPRAVELKKEIAEIEAEVVRRGGTAPSRPVTASVYQEARLRLDTNDPRLDFERGQVENLLRQHADLRDRIQNVQVQKDIAEAAFEYRYSVISPAKLPRGPIKPYPVLFLAGGLMGGLAFAFFAAAAADVRTGRVIERWQLEQQLELPVLAEIRK